MFTMPNKFPAFQLYAKEFVSDRNVLVMNAKEVGAYFLLICACWIEEDLPNDLHDLALTARMPFKEFVVAWEKRIARCFKLDERKNVFFHPRLRKEITKQKAYSRKQSDKGKESGRKRREKKALNPRTPVEPQFNNGSTEREPNRTLLIPDSGQDSSYEESLERERPAQEFGDPKNTHKGSHRAINLFTAVGFKPDPATYDAIIAALGNEPDIKRLSECYKVWVARGFKKHNIAWATEWYPNGIPESKTNGTNNKSYREQRSNEAIQSRDRRNDVKERIRERDAAAAASLLGPGVPDSGEVIRDVGTKPN